MSLFTSGWKQQNVSDGKCPKFFTFPSTFVSEISLSSHRRKHVVCSHSSFPKPPLGNGAAWGRTLKCADTHGFIKQTLTEGHQAIYHSHPSLSS